MNCDKKRILVTTSSFPRWENDIEGGALFVYEICRRISDKFEVYVLAPLINDAPKFTTLGNIHVIRYRYFIFCRNNLINASGIAETLSQNKLYYLFVPFFLFSQLFAVKKTIKKYNIDIVHAHWIIPQGLIACMYKKLFNKQIKIICTSHGSDLNMDFGFIGKKLLQFTKRNTDSLTVVSQNLKEKAVSIGFKNIEVIPMGIDANKFKHIETDEIRNKYNLKGNILLFVGIFNEVKGIEYLLKAIPVVLKAKPNTTLLLVGDGILKSKLQKIVEDLNISNNVIFTGYISNDELPKYFSCSDILVMPSLNEGLGLVWVEAMACETLVIASNIEVFQNHIKNNENGFIVPVKNSDAIAEKIIELFENSNDLNAIRNNARKYAQENFDWETVKNNYLQLIEKL